MDKFSDSELPVMKLLWRHGEMKPAEIQKLHSSPIKNSAIRFTLSALVDKGKVKRRQIGKAFHYRAVAKRSATFKKSLKEMVDVFFEGSTDSLLMTLIKNEKLSEDDLLTLKKLAEGDGNGNTKVDRRGQEDE